MNNRVRDRRRPTGLKEAAPLVFWGNGWWWYVALCGGPYVPARAVSGPDDAAASPWPPTSYTPIPDPDGSHPVPEKHRPPPRSRPQASKMRSVTDGMFVRPVDLPSGECRDFRDSSFFSRNAVDLPTPAQVRQRHVRVDEKLVSASRPRPVVFQELGLLVKYGSEITIAEAQCLWFFNRHMKGRVPTPELYGWRCDGEETFIYMELVRGDTLEERWPSLCDEERRSICRELKGCVDAWRGLRQETEPYFVGKRPEVASDLAVGLFGTG